MLTMEQDDDLVDIGNGLFLTQMEKDFVKGWKQGFVLGFFESIEKRINQHKQDGHDEGMIDAYYNDMKLSPENIAKKMNKPLEEVQEIIQSLSDES